MLLPPVIAHPFAHALPSYIVPQSSTHAKHSSKQPWYCLDLALGNRAFWWEVWLQMRIIIAIHTATSEIIQKMLKINIIESTNAKIQYLPCKATMCSLQNVLPQRVYCVQCIKMHTSLFCMACLVPTQYAQNIKETKNNNKQCHVVMKLF